MDGREIRKAGDGHKLLYYRTLNNRNGMAITVAKTLRDKISLVERKSNQLMNVKIHADSKAMNVVAAYAFKLKQRQ